MNEIDAHVEGRTGDRHLLTRRTGASLNFRTDLQECERRARETLDEQAFRAAWRNGDSLSFDDAVAFALDEEP
jgi:hypothetical protein